MAWILILFIFNSPTVGAAEEKSHFVVECTIVSEIGVPIRKFGGGRCIFFPDGGLVSGTGTNLKFYNFKMETKWDRPVETHHQLNLSIDGQKILVMSSSFNRSQNKNLRFDRLAIYDLDGREIKAFDFFNSRRKLLELLPKHIVPPPYSIGKNMFNHVPQDVRFEFSHANSFYEIPENASGPKSPAFAAGNYIVNVNGLGVILILDRDLKEILWSMPQPMTTNNQHSVHDVQVEPDGHLLIYNNRSFGYPGNFSSIDKINPLNGERKVLFRAQPPKNFFSPECGGVQRLKNGNILFSDSTREWKIVESDPSGKVVSSITYVVGAKANPPEMFQQVKKVDLSEFLKKNEGL